MGRGITTLTKELANAALIAGTAGTSVIGSKPLHASRGLCPVCGGGSAATAPIENY